MAFTALEIIALIFAAITIVKLVMLLTVPKVWMSFGKAIIKSRVLLIAIYLAMVGVLGYFLLKTTDVVTIFVAMLLGGVLTGVSLHPHFKDIYGFYKDKTAGDWLKHHWLVFIIWFAIIGYVLYTILV